MADEGTVHYLTKVEFNAIGTTEILVFVTWPLLCILGAIYNRRKKRAEEEKVRADLRPRTRAEVCDSRLAANQDVCE